MNYLYINKHLESKNVYNESQYMNEPKNNKKHEIKVY